MTALVALVPTLDPVLPELAEALSAHPPGTAAGSARVPAPRPGSDAAQDVRPGN